MRLCPVCGHDEDWHDREKEQGVRVCGRDINPSVPPTCEVCRANLAKIQKEKM